MPSLFPSTEGSPLQQINQRFLDATSGIPEVVEGVPQVPYGGILEVGDLAVDLRDREILDWWTFATTPLEGPRLTHALRETVQSHEEVDVPVNFGLRQSLPFAYELVISGAVHAFDVLHRGDDSVATTAIMPINTHEVAGSSEFLAAESNRHFVRGLFDAVRRRLARTDVPDEQNVVLELQRYRPAIAEISQRYHRLRGELYAQVETADPETRQRILDGDKDLQAAKASELNGQRARLMSVAGPAIHEALTPFMVDTDIPAPEGYSKRAGVRAFAGALACGIPSQELLDKHRAA